MVTCARFFRTFGLLLGLSSASGCDQTPEGAAGPAPSASTSTQATAVNRAPRPPSSAHPARHPGAAPAWLGEYVDQDPALAGAAPANRPGSQSRATDVAAQGGGLSRAQTEHSKPSRSASLGLPAAPTGTMRAYPQNVSDRPVPRIGNQPWEIDEHWRAQHERLLRDRRRREAKLVFLGDSITQAFGMAPAYKQTFGKYEPLNLGLSGDHTQNVLWRIEHGALDGLSPEVVVVLIGINNLGGGFSPAETVSGVRAVVSAVQAHLPTTPIVLLGILPARHEPGAPLRQKIAEANRALAKQPPTGRVTFQDIGKVLVEPDGTISKEILRDYLHPTAAGYERLSAALLPLITPFVQ